MSYRIEWEQDALDALEGLDTTIVQRILLRITWLSVNLDNMKLQALTGKLKGYFKLRVGGLPSPLHCKPGGQTNYHGRCRTSS